MALTLVFDSSAAQDPACQLTVYLYLFSKPLHTFSVESNSGAHGVWRILSRHRNLLARDTRPPKPCRCVSNMAFGFGCSAIIARSLLSYLPKRTQYNSKSSTKCHSKYHSKYYILRDNGLTTTLSNLLFTPPHHAKHDNNSKGGTRYVGLSREISSGRDEPIFSEKVVHHTNNGVSWCEGPRINPVSSPSDVNVSALIGHERRVD